MLSNLFQVPNLDETHVLPRPGYRGWIATIPRARAERSLFQVERNRVLAPSHSFTIGANHVTQPTGSLLATLSGNLTESKTVWHHLMKACTTFTYTPASRLVVIDQGQMHRHRSSCDHNLSRQWHDAAKRTYCYTERHVQALNSGATPRQDVCNRFDRLGLPKFVDAIPPRHLVFLSNLDERSSVLKPSSLSAFPIPMKR